MTSELREAGANEAMAMVGKWAESGGGQHFLQVFLR